MFKKKISEIFTYSRVYTAEYSEDLFPFLYFAPWSVHEQLYAAVPLEMSLL